MDAPPLLFIIFNRPETTIRVFESIRKVKPTRLFVAADGPRAQVVSDGTQCELARKIIDKIDWKCELETLFHDTNLGCKQGPTTAIDWFFDHVEEGIILEDDCVPHPTFFRFCQELLDYYRNDTKIMMIGGNNFQVGRQRGHSSYYFSVFGHIWGWATWKRAWKWNDPNLEDWPELRDTDWIKHFMLTKDGAKKYTNNLDNVYARNLDAWDYAWSYSRWRQNGLSIVPIKNLVKNIGFGNNATHTKKKRQLSSIEAEPMAFPLKHPSNIKRNFMADLFTVRHLYLGYPLPEDVGITRSIYDPIRKKLPERFRWIMDTLLNPIMRK